MYYNGCFLRRTLRRPSREKWEVPARGQTDETVTTQCQHLSAQGCQSFSNTKKQLFSNTKTRSFSRTKSKGGPEKPKAKRQQTNRITVMIGCWHLLSSPCRQLIRMRDHEGMRLQHLRRFFFFICGQSLRQWPNFL